MGFSAPLVRGREDGVRRSRWHVVECTVCAAGACIGFRSRSGARTKATPAVDAPFFFDLHVGVDSRRWHRPPKIKEAETAAVSNGAGVGTGVTQKTARDIGKRSDRCSLLVSCFLVFSALLCSSTAYGKSASMLARFASGLA